jgi:hypothetical protein
VAPPTIGYIFCHSPGSTSQTAASRALHTLARAAQAIGEQEEYERCSQFLKDSSPTAAQTLG